MFYNILPYYFILDNVNYIKAIEYKKKLLLDNRISVTNYYY